MKLPWGNRAEKERASAHRELAMSKATSAIADLQDEMTDRALREQDFAAFVAEEGPDLILSFEMHYLWGFFSAHSATAYFPTGWADRTQMLLANWLVSMRGHTLKEAVHRSAAVRSAFNAANPVNDAISELGRRAYGRSNRSDLANTIVWLMGRRGA